MAIWRRECSTRFLSRERVIATAWDLMRIEAYQRQVVNYHWRHAMSQQP